MSHCRAVRTRPRIHSSGRTPITWTIRRSFTRSCKRFKGPIRTNARANRSRTMCQSWNKPVLCGLKLGLSSTRIYMFLWSGENGLKTIWKIFQNKIHILNVINKLCVNRSLIGSTSSWPRLNGFWPLSM